MATLCPNCGAELPVAHARFCSNCGTLLSTEPAQTLESSSSNSHSIQARSPALAPSDTPVWGTRHSHSVPQEQIAQQPRHPANAAGHELRVKVWESNKDEPVKAISVPQEEMPESVKTEEAVSSLPTVPLMGSVLAPTKPSQTPEESPPVVPSPDVQDVNKARQATVEQLDTTPLTSYSPKELVKPLTPAPSVAPALLQRQNVFPMRASDLSVRSRRPLFIGLALIVALIVIGSIAWAIVLQPFSVPTVTNPQQHFRDTRFGLSLSYPTGWRVQVDTKASALHFADSTNTAQVNITTSNAAGTNEALYAQKLLSQLGMTNVKPAASLTFAGAHWLQFQGSVLEKGASYTETLLVTVHGAHLYTLAQLAPQDIYTQEDHLIFTPIRSSLRFLP